VKEDTFEQVVIRDVENIWIVAYIDPACGACKKFSIEWEKLRTVETIKYKKVKLGYVDVTLEASRKIVGKYTQGKEVEGTPTLFVYGNEKMAPIEFKGDLTAKNINEYLVGYAEQNGYKYTTDADVDYNHALAKQTGSESALPTKGPIKVVGATKITNRQIQGSSSYGGEAGRVDPLKQSKVTYYDDYNKGNNGWKAHNKGYGDAGAQGKQWAD